MFYSGVILFNTFSASYTSFLSVVEIAQPFNSIPELAQTDFMIGGPAGSSYKVNFEVKYFFQTFCNKLLILANQQTFK